MVLCGQRNRVHSVVTHKACAKEKEKHGTEAVF